MKYLLFLEDLDETSRNFHSFDGFLKKKLEARAFRRYNTRNYIVSRRLSKDFEEAGDKSRIESRDVPRRQIGEIERFALCLRFI